MSQLTLGGENGNLNFVMHSKETTFTPTYASEGVTPRRVLVVDDDRSVRTIAATLLETMGFEAMTADCGEVALQLFAAHEVEIAFVLLDLTMPQMGGDEVLAALRRLNRDVRVLLSSGYHADDAQDLIADESVAFIQKPYRLAELQQAVRDLLEF